jgi:nitrate reductase beta subunit
MRKQQVLGVREEQLATEVGMDVDGLEDLYRLLAIAKYEDRYGIPQAHTELAQRLAELPGTCGLDFEGGPGGWGAIPRPAQALNQRFMLTERPEHRFPGSRPLPVWNQPTEGHP